MQRCLTLLVSGCQAALCQDRNPPPFLSARPVAYSSRAAYVVCEMSRLLLLARMAKFANHVVAWPLFPRLTSSQAGLGCGSGVSSPLINSQASYFHLVFGSSYCIPRAKMSAGGGGPLEFRPAQTLGTALMFHDPLGREGARADRDSCMDWLFTKLPTRHAMLF